MDLAYLSDFVGTRKRFATTLLTNEYINTVLVNVALWMDPFELFLVDLMLVCFKASFNVMVEPSEV